MWWVRQLEHIFPLLFFPIIPFYSFSFLHRYPKTEIEYCRQNLWKVEPNRDQKWWWGEIQLCRQGCTDSIFNQLEKKCKIIYICRKVLITKVKRIFIFQYSWCSFTLSEHVLLIDFIKNITWRRPLKSFSAIPNV